MRSIWSMLPIPLICLGCFGKNQEVTPGSGTNDEKEKTVIQKLSSVMKNLSEARGVFLESTVPTGARYLLADKDQLTSSLDWITYSLIEGISGDTAYTLTTKTFIKKNSQARINFRLLDENPEFHWSFKTAQIFNAELSKIVSAKASLNDTCIYEFSICKSAEFSIDRSFFDDSTFEYIFTTMYTFSKDGETPSLESFDKFKKSYGLASGGVLYDITVNEYQTTQLDGESDVVGLVKANGRFFKQTSSKGKLSVFKIYYNTPGTPDFAVLEKAKKAKEKLSPGQISLIQKEVLNARSFQSSSSRIVNAINPIRAAIEK